jgi:hypothetical protein
MVDTATSEEIGHFFSGSIKIGTKMRTFASRFFYRTTLSSQEHILLRSMESIDNENIKTVRYGIN